MSISIPGADYTPQLAGYTGQGAFRFWCQKVLPIVYDDSLSYYELLNKVVNYLNNVIADVASVEDNVGELNKSYGLLQTYVNEHMQEIVDVVNQYTEYTDNYFDNLNVQAEINNKLDVMASDGSLSTLIGPIVAVTAPDVITQWLSDHVTPTTPIVDDTLSISGAAADAKVTGDKVTELNSELKDNFNRNRYDLNDIESNLDYMFDGHTQSMQIGSIAASGVVGARTTTVRNAYVQPKKNNEILTLLNDNWRAELHFYKNNSFTSSGYLGKESYFNKSEIRINISRECEKWNADYYALMFYRWTGSNIDLETDVTQAEISSFSDNYIFYYADGIKKQLDGMAENIIDTDMWSINGINSVGSYSPATNRLATKRRISFPEFSKIETMGNYTINLGVWDATEKYIGKLQIDGTFGTNNEGWVRFFDLTKYPNHSFVVILRNESSPNSNMNISEAENCILRKNYISLEKTMNKIVGSDDVDILLDWTSEAGKTYSFPAEIKAGDVIRAKIKGFTSPCDITVVTEKDGVNKDVLINAFAVQGVGVTVGTVATTDANAVKVYCKQANVSFKVYRVISKSADYKSLVEQSFKANARIRKNESEILEATDSNSYQILGESAIYNNKRYMADMTFKMVMLDNNYKYFSVANIKRIIDQMSNVNLNSLLIGFGGSGRGLCFKLDDMTIESYGKTYDLEDCISTSSGKYLTEIDMEEIINYASSKGIEIIPYLGMPGHFTPFLAHQPQFRYQADATSINIDDRQACDYAYKIAELYMKWFARHGSKYWVFGADEFGDVHNGYYYLHSAGNYNYAKFINEIAYIAAKYRMIPFAWNDGYCIDGDIIPMLNREVPIMYWTKDNEHWATTAEIQNNGNSALINSSVSIYYVVNGSQVTEEQMRAFNVHNFADETVVANPKGACFCIWIGNLERPALDDDGNAITTAVLPLITAFGETIASQFN